MQFGFCTHTPFRQNDSFVGQAWAELENTKGMVVVGIHTAYKNEFSIMLILLGMLYSRRNPKQYLGIFDFEKEKITLLLYIQKLHV